METIRQLIAKLIGPAPSPSPSPDPRPDPSPAPARDTSRQWRQRELARLLDANTAERLRYYTEHPDGYIRQAAVEHCGQLSAPGLVTLLVERVNDWVPNVRKAARHALDQALPAAAPDDMIAALPAACRLEHAQREQHAAWLGEFERTVLRLAGEEALLRAVRQAPARVARAAFRLLVNAAQLSPEALFRAVVPENRDIVLATRAYTQLEATGVEPGEELLVLALRSRVAPNRTRALRALLARGATGYADEALFARQAQMRAIAVSYLTAQGVDVGAVYAGALREAGTPPGRTIACLAELGRLRQPAWLGEVRAWLDDASPAIRAAAALAWLQLAPQAKDEIAAHLLGDPAPRLRALALSLMRKQGAYVPFAQARALLEKFGDREALLAVAAFDPWNWLETIALLAASERPDPAFMVRLRHEMTMWMVHSRHSCTRPGEVQRERLAPLLRGGALQPLVLGTPLQAEWRYVLAQAGLAVE